MTDANKWREAVDKQLDELKNAPSVKMGLDIVSKLEYYLSLYRNYLEFRK